MPELKWRGAHGSVFSTMTIRFPVHGSAHRRRLSSDHPDCQFIYTDEVVTDKNLKPVVYHLKPAYDEVLLSGVNYINHLSCYRRDRLLKFSGLRAGYEGSQDYDLLLRYLRDLKPAEIKHLPYPAYCWRRTAEAFSSRFMERATEAARKALAERYRRGDVEPEVGVAITPTLHRMRFDTLPRRWPSVSIVIPNRDSFALIARLLCGPQGQNRLPGLRNRGDRQRHRRSARIAALCRSRAGADPIRGRDRAGAV